MVVTRSQQGDERPDPGTTQGTPIDRTQRTSGAPANVVRPPPVLEAFLSSAAAGRTSPHEESSADITTEERSVRDRQEGSARSGTLRPGDTRSVRSAASRKRLLAELEAKERMAELKLKKVQAEEELQKLRLQRLQIEEEDDESVEEEREEELESVRIQEWIKRTPLKENDTAQPPPGEKKEDAEEEVQHTGDIKRHDKTEEARRETEECQRKTLQPQPVVDVATLAATLLNAARSNREPPKYLQELPFFNGSSNEWLGFRAAYESSSGYFTSTENLARIRKSLRGPAKEAVGCLLLSQPDPKSVLDALERRFGRPEALIHAEIEKMKSLHKLTDNPRDLCIFAGSVSNIVGTIEALKKPHYLYNPELARVVVEKLTPILRNKWYDFAASKKEETPDIKKLSIFLNEEADKCGAYALPEIIKEERSFQERRNFKKERTFTVNKEEADYTHCPTCKKQHKLTECELFLGATVNDRWEIAKKNHICFRCLKSKHRRFNCKAAPCGKQGCNMRHHKLLHHDRREPAPQQHHEAVTSTKEITTAACHKSSRRAYLKIIPVVLSGPLSSIETYALCDEGSTVTLVDASIADVIGADGPKTSMWLQGISSEMRHEKSKSVSMKIRGKFASEEYNIEAARTVNRLDFATESVKKEDMEDCTHLEDIMEEIVYERASPKILLGQDNIDLIVTRRLRAGKKNQPVASYTQLGWVLHGCQSSLTGTVAFCGNIQVKKNNEDMEEMIKNHFKLESLCIEPRKPREDPEEKALVTLQEKSRRLPDGRFETALPWKDENFAIPNNFTQAERRLHSLEKKLDRDEDLKKKYEERINNLLKSGYAECASSPPPLHRTWYLPHFPVVNAAKPHKPPRLVHDAAARYAGISLNDLLLSGPDLLQSLPGVIMRFRQHPHAVSADLKEMFMQIKVREEDRDTLRFLWRGNRREGRPDEYRMTSVIFGATSSPFTALYIKNRNAEDFQQGTKKEIPQEADEERKPEKCHIEELKNEERRHPHLPRIEKFSKWTRLIRTTARVLQFIRKLKKEKIESTHATRKRTKKDKDIDPSWSKINKKNAPSQRAPRASPPPVSYVELPADLLIQAEKLWVKTSQQDSFHKEIQRMEKNMKPTSGDRLATLATYVDAEGILRLRGRVAAASGVQEEQVNPAVLDGRHYYTRLYIRHVHEKLHHGGVEMVVNELRQRAWVLKIRPTVRDVIKSCIPCKFTRAKPTCPVTGDLPAARLAHHARPFTYTGLDYFGPIEVTVARHREKRYGALFTCMTSRAIHIEIAHSLSADSAISALRRFIARRGCPKEIWSDNATCFKAADKELAEAALDGLQHEVTARHITWRYICPAAPFMGGAWERMVRAVKEALKTTLHERCPSDETLATLLIEVENTVNSRPLTHVAVTPDEPEALTPNHILIGPNCHVPPPGHFTMGDLTAKQHWRRAQALADVFWRRWVREYLPILQSRREPHNADVPPKVGDYALICDPNLPRNTWPRGKIVRVYPGADGEVRIVDIQLSSGNVLQRPTRKIVVIPGVSPPATAGEVFTTTVK